MKKEGIIILFIIIIVIILLVLVIAFRPKDESVPKSDIGSECQKLSDCVGAATNCVDNICIRSTFVGDPCDEDEPCMDGQTCDSVTMVCRISNGQECQNNVECISDSSCILTTFCNSDSKYLCGKKNPEGFPCPCQDGLCCEDGVCVPEAAQVTGFLSEFPSIPNGVKSFCKCRGKYIILQINIYFGYKDTLEIRYSVLKLKEIFYFHNVFGVSNGDIFELDSDLDDETWLWKETSYPNNIRHCSVSHDGNYLWLQDDEYGYLYKDRLLKKFKTKYIRIMGRTGNTYLELRNGHGIRYPIRDKIDDITWGVMKMNGDVVKSNKRNFLDGDNVLELL